VGDGGGILGEGAGGEVGETASSGVAGELGRIKEEGVAPTVGIANSGGLFWSMDMFAWSLEDSLLVSALAVPFALLAEGDVALCEAWVCAFAAEGVVLRFDPWVGFSFSFGFSSGSSLNFCLNY
jgi:hypothetical protein